MNSGGLDHNHHNQAAGSPTMGRRVHFASNDQAAKKAGLHVPDASSFDDQRRGLRDTSLPPADSWYTPKELKAMRRDISSYLVAEKKGKQPQQQTPSLDANENCMRGLELFASGVRRELQKHYAKSIIEAQRRIKASNNRRKREEDSILLQQVAEKYSQYARERAVQAAARDEVDCRRLHDEGCEPACKSRKLSPQQIQTTAPSHSPVAATFRTPGEGP